MADDRKPNVLWVNETTGVLTNDRAAYSAPHEFVATEYHLITPVELAAHDAEAAEKARADERAVVNAVEALLDRWDQPASRNAVSPFTPEGVLDIAVADLRKTIDAARTPDPNGDNT